MTAEPRWADQDSQSTAFEPVMEGPGTQAGTYQGMRWFKCDLQVQTPEDAAHWQDGDLRLGSPRRPGGDVSAIQDKARRFLRRCHELELDVVGITDHNFSNLEDHRDWFLTHLVEKNKAVATELGRQPLWILPGFEVDIGYHVLCLFEPARSVRNLQEVNRTLTQLGLREGDRYQNGTLKRLRRGDEYVSLAELLSCIQDEQGGIVVAAHADQKDGLLFSPKNQDDFQLMGLLAVELTSLGTEKYRDIVRGKNREWGREDSPPAWLMSSDAKSLAVDEQGHPGPNSLGYRHTWIKMSRPSIEALRQAFLDPESRLRPSCMASPAPDPSPIRHAFIRSIRIQGVDFLEDQEIEFSPGLNCLIGGRGSGKSTVLEYLRVMMGKRRDVVEDDSTKERIDRVWNTVDSQKSQIEVRWQNQDGQEDRILQQGGEPTVAGRPIDDPETWFKLLPARFFSQQQISQMTKVDDPREGAGQARHLVPLVEAFRADELRDLDLEEAAVRRELETLLVRRRELAGLERDRKRVAQEYEELDRQWKARSEIKVEALRHEGAQAERQYFQRLKDSLAATVGLLTTPARDLAESHRPLDSTAARWPHADWFRALDEKVEQAKDGLALAVEEAVTRFQREVTALVKADPSFPSLWEEITSSEKRFQEACQKRGLSPQDVGRLQEIANQRTAKKGDLERLDAMVSESPANLARIRDRLEALHALWRKRFRLLQVAATDANQGAKLATNQPRFIEVTVSYGGDRGSFAATWRHLAPTDRRTKLGRCWDELEGLVFQTFRDLADEIPSPWQMLKEFLEDPDACRSSDLRNKLEELDAHFDTRSEDWEKARLTRVGDSVDLTLFREDGSPAGRISDGTLSDGQRNTAALALLLAQGDSPLVIDQPEDELDSNFIFRDLVPMLRQATQSRQVLLATHNANLPVNGDAELVVALEAREGRGTIRAQGGLDRREVTDSVLDIMEGSREAFRRRREKYHF